MQDVGHRLQGAECAARGMWLCGAARGMWLCGAARGMWLCGAEALELTRVGHETKQGLAPPVLVLLINTGE